MPKMFVSRCLATVLALGAVVMISACATGQPADNPSAGASLNETRSSGPSRWELVRWQRTDG